MSPSRDLNPGLLSDSPRNVGNGWVAGGCWDDEITRDDWDHSRTFPA